MTTPTPTSSAPPPAAKLAGTVIGTPGSYRNQGATVANAFDGNAATYFDGPAANNQWAGLDLGTPHVVTSVAYAPRAGWAGRMVGGQFQGSNAADFSAGVGVLATVTAVPPAGLTTVNLTNTTAFRYVRYLSPPNGFGNVAEVQFFGTPAAPVAVPVAVPTTSTTPLAAPKLIAGQTTTLAPGTAYAGIVQFNGLAGATLNGSGSTLIGPAGTNAITTWTDTTGAMLSSIELSSADGSGQGMVVRGDGMVIDNVDLGGAGGLQDGIVYEEATNVTITGGKQTGRVAARCHFFTNVVGLTQTGGTFGPSQGQSTTRASAPGVTNGVFTDVTWTMVGSDNPIAAAAWHSLHKCVFRRCTAIGGEFSCDSAGMVADEVGDCLFDQVTVIDARFAFHPIARRNTVTKLKVVNDLHWAVTLTGCTGNTFDGCEFWSLSGFWSDDAANDTAVSNTVVYTPNPVDPAHPLALLFSNTLGAANDKGGNLVVQVTAAEWAARKLITTVVTLPAAIGGAVAGVLGAGATTRP